MRYLTVLSTHRTASVGAPLWAGALLRTTPHSCRGTSRSVPPSTMTSRDGSVTFTRTPSAFVRPTPTPRRHLSTSSPTPVSSTSSCVRTLSVCLLSVCLSVCLSICLSVYLSVCLSVCPSVRPSVRPSVHPSVRLSVRLSVCLSVCLSVPSVFLCCRPLVTRDG